MDIPPGFRRAIICRWSISRRQMDKSIGTSWHWIWVQNQWHRLVTSVILIFIRCLYPVSIAILLHMLAYIASAQCTTYQRSTGHIFPRRSKPLYQDLSWQFSSMNPPWCRWLWGTVSFFGKLKLCLDMLRTVRHISFFNQAQKTNAVCFQNEWFIGAAHCLPFVKNWSTDPLWWNASLWFVHGFSYLDKGRDKTQQDPQSGNWEPIIGNAGWYYAR